MIISRIMGGLGNQMFQYALARSLAIKNNALIAIDESAINADSLREPRLDLLNTKISKDVEPGQYQQVAEKGFRFQASVLDLTGNILLTGYWQSEKYFKDIREQLVEDFSIKAPIQTENKKLLKVVEGCQSVSVHIRRTDYVTNSRTNQVHGLCSLDYYKKAIEIIDKNVKDSHLVFFSDDIEWVKDNLPEDKKRAHTYVDINGEGEEHLDMFLMSRCKHNIIANSSFSWWGAWLNQNKDKIVVTPTTWFQAKHLDTADLIPETWIKI